MFGLLYQGILTFLNLSLLVSMKKILLLTVHPDENSLSHQFANIALDELKDKYDVEQINLYQDKEGDF